MSRAYGVQLLNVSATMRALVVNALREKASGDRGYADGLGNLSSDQRAAAQLRAQADQAEILADEIEAQ